MRVKFLTNMAVRGHSVQAGEVFDVPDDELWRLAGRYEPAPDVSHHAVREPIEERDPEPEHRDPKSRSKK